MSKRKVEKNRDTVTKNEENINSEVQFAYEQSGELTDLEVEKGRKELSADYERNAEKKKQNRL
ncbi:hypothetical protein C8P63_12364 [Melghirimyces profundicolus]|uniref:YfhD-like protein n=1 Tax=Melghirimyces profundicolus TaxID=1242148 RepID=A0A2T6BG58_9BACL|nr:hypothetical protein [Melghirimyces profundicolus]PTX55040.1 hypothetical protein C8P63_12364 [Melghirimyces profundicolus]